MMSIGAIDVMEATTSIAPKVYYMRSGISMPRSPMPRLTTLDRKSVV